MEFVKKIIFACVVAIASPWAFASGPNLIVNGGFEAFTVAGPLTTIYAGQTNLTGWSVGGDSVDLIHSYWMPASGSYSLDLSGADDGTISQTFATVVGGTYQVTFSLAGNPVNPADPIKTVQVGLYDQGFSTFDTSGLTQGNMGWMIKSFQFTASGTSSTLFFAGTQESPYGVALDNISVTAVPEPEVLSMLLAGLGLIGVVARRRRRISSK